MLVIIVVFLKWVVVIDLRIFLLYLFRLLLVVRVIF